MIGDLVYNSDLQQWVSNSGDTSTSTEQKEDCYFIPPHDHHHHHHHPCPPPPYPPYPTYAWLVPPPPPAGYPYPPYDEQSDIKQNEVEKSICKLSKKAAVLRTLIDNIEEKNKPVIIKSSAASYNLGSYKTKDPEEPEIYIEDEQIATIIEILKAELEKIKDEIKELSDQLVEE